MLPCSLHYQIWEYSRESESCYLLFNHHLPFFAKTGHHCIVMYWHQRTEYQLLVRWCIDSLLLAIILHSPLPPQHTRSGVAINCYICSSFLPLPIQSELFLVAALQLSQRHHRTPTQSQYLGCIVIFSLHLGSIATFAILEIWENCYITIIEREFSQISTYTFYWME